MELNAAFKFYVFDETGASSVDEQKLRDIGNNFVENLRKDLENDLQYENGDPNIVLSVTSSVSMDGEDYFVVNANIKFSSTKAYDNSVIMDYLKQKLTTMTKTYGDMLYRTGYGSDTGSNHHISEVKVTFLTGGKRKRKTKKRRSRRRFTYRWYYIDGSI